MKTTLLRIMNFVMSGFLHLRTTAADARLCAAIASLSVILLGGAHAKISIVDSSVATLWGDPTDWDGHGNRFPVHG